MSNVEPGSVSTRPGTRAAGGLTAATGLAAAAGTGTGTGPGPGTGTPGGVVGDGRAPAGGVVASAGRAIVAGGVVAGAGRAIAAGGGDGFATIPGGGGTMVGTVIAACDGAAGASGRMADRSGVRTGAIGGGAVGGRTRGGVARMLGSGPIGGGAVGGRARPGATGGGGNGGGID